MEKGTSETLVEEEKTKKIVLKKEEEPKESKKHYLALKLPKSKDSENESENKNEENEEESSDRTIKFQFNGTLQEKNIRNRKKFARSRR